MSSGNSNLRTPDVVAALAVACLIAASGYLVFLFAPTEVTMGHVQRIVYLHVSVAWCGLAGCVAMGITAAMHLVRRTSLWDHWSLASAELGWLCTTLTLVTGSLWAHDAWNTWWTWEPRLTSSLILWLIFAGYFLVRSSVEEPERRARIGAVLAIMTLADVPIIIMATRWFRGIHPVAPEMDARMRFVLWISVFSCTVLCVWLAVLRRRQLELAARVKSLHEPIINHASR